MTLTNKTTLSDVRLHLAAAITSHKGAETALAEASAAVALQSDELAKAQADLLRCDAWAKSGTALKVSNIRKRVRGEKSEIVHDAFSNSRRAIVLAEERVQDEIIALQHLEAEAADASNALRSARRALALAIEAVLCSEALDIMREAKAADAKAAWLRGQLMALDACHLSVPNSGVSPRSPLTNGTRDNAGIVDFLRNPSATETVQPKFATKAAWTALFKVLQTDAFATLASPNLLAAAAAIAPPAPLPVQPAERYEDSAAYRHERRQFVDALQPPVPIDTVGAEGPNIHRNVETMRWEDTPAYKAAQREVAAAGAQGWPSLELAERDHPQVSANVRHEDTPAYANRFK